MTSKIPPIHPILDEDCIKGFGITQNELALAIGVESQFWLDLRTHHDLVVETDRIRDQVDAIQPLQTA